MNNNPYHAERLEIPENIPLRWEMFRGFGAAELIRTLVLALPLCIGAVLYSQLSSSPMRVLTALFAVIFGLTLVGGFFVKQSYNLSLYDYVCNAWRYTHSQQSYENIKMEVYVLDKSQESEGSSIDQ